MQRRTLLHFGLGTAIVLAAGGIGLNALSPGWQGSRLSERGRTIFRALALSVLEGMLPATKAEQEAALVAHLDRLDATIAGFPAATQAELSQLISLLAVAPGRLGLTSLAVDWADATPADVQQALQTMRGSSLPLRQQVYHGLRDLTNAAYFAAPETWPALGYPGPMKI